VGLAGQPCFRPMRAWKGADTPSVVRTGTSAYSAARSHSPTRPAACSVSQRCAHGTVPWPHCLLVGLCACPTGAGGRHLAAPPTPHPPTHTHITPPTHHHPIKTRELAMFYYTGLALQVPSTIVAGAAMMMPEGGCLPAGSASHSCRRLAAAGTQGHGTSIC
jgi:hypothetical protein